MYKPELLPIPEHAKPGVGRLAKYPFRTMSIGESFLIPPSDQTTSTARNMQVYCWRIGQKLSKSFTRTILDDGTIQVIRHN